LHLAGVEDEGSVDVVVDGAEGVDDAECAGDVDTDRVGGEGLRDSDQGETSGANGEGLIRILVGLRDEERQSVIAGALAEEDLDRGGEDSVVTSGENAGEFGLQGLDVEHCRNLGSVADAVAVLLRQLVLADSGHAQAGAGLDASLALAAAQAPLRPVRSNCEENAHSTQKSRQVRKQSAQP
jgi:hypothetical protein